VTVAAPAHAPALVVSGVAKSFGERRAVHDVSFELARGELLAIVAPTAPGRRRC
jgi:ABC-type phosphonate transport system ATPase subunit